MPATIRLEANRQPLRIPGTSIDVIAPGLRGELTHTTAAPAATGTRRGRRTAFAATIGGATEASLAEAGLKISDTLAIAAPTPDGAAARRPRPRTRTARRTADPRDDELRLDLTRRPDVLFAIYRDASGIVSFHFAEEPRRAAGATVRGSARRRTIVIPLRPSVAPTRTGRRDVRGAGLAGKLVDKLIELVVRRATREAAKLGVFGAVKWWENKYRAAQGFHRGTPRQFLAAKPLSAGARDLRALAGEPSLLFLHGTTSSTQGAFGSLADFAPLAQKLWRAYDDRVIGFNHHTLTRGVAENAIAFFEALPAADAPYVFDAVVHSRGGLLARTIAALGEGRLDPAFVGRLAGHQQPWSLPRGVTVQVRRIVFVGTPNNGTDLADPDHLPQALNWLASVTELLPAGAVTFSLGAILSIVALVAEAGLIALPGLADQAVDADRETGELLRKLNALDHRQAAADYYSIEAHFRPAGALLGAALAFGIDAMFRKQHNDLIVPTRGISGFGRYRFSPADRIKTFTPDDKLQVHHTCYFTQRATWDHICRALQI